MQPPSFDDLLAARSRIAPHVHRTPVLTSRTLDERTGARLFFKAEHLQRIGAFKARGAHNAVLSLPGDVAARGVVTHSSGNHAAGLALAARSRGIPAHIVMPSNSSRAKVASVERLGGILTFCEPTQAAREAAAAERCAATGAALIPPFDDPAIIAGQGTAALEFLEEVPGLDAVLTPLGGGGLLSGTALAVRGMRPAVRVYGTEPAGADDGARSFRSGVRQPLGEPRTIADGLRVGVGRLNFEIIRAQVDDVATVSEEAILEAMRLVWEVMKQLIEPSAAVPLAALLERRLPLDGLRVGIILSGGNADLDALPRR